MIRRRGEHDQRMPRVPPPLPAHLGGAAFSFADATVAGVGRRRLRASDVIHPHRGVYTSDSADGLHGACVAAVPLLGDRRFFSHLTAARLWGIPTPGEWMPGEPLHIVTLVGAEPLRRPGIRGWESATSPGVAVIDGLPVADAADVWAQLSIPGSVGTDPGTGARRALSPEWLVAAGDYLLTGPRIGSTRTPLVTLDRLAEVTRGHRGKRGSKALA